MAEAENQETLTRYGHGTPNDWVERNLYSSTRGTVWPDAGADLILFGAAGLPSGVQMMWIPFHAAGVINGIGHYWAIATTMLPMPAPHIALGIWIGGEELHNNHHTYPTSAKFSLKWFEFDLGWTYIRAMQAMASPRCSVWRRCPKCQHEAAIDLETLQASSPIVMTCSPSTRAI